MVPRFVLYEPDDSARAVVVVCHGLNLHPDRMATICELLRVSGALVVRMALSGHRQDYEELTAVTRETWLDDHRAILSDLSRVCAEHGTSTLLPVGFVGQSLGALTFCDFQLNHRPEGACLPRVRRALFLAPAIALRPTTQLLRPLAAISRRLPVPSASSPVDRVFGRLPAAAYRALYESYDAVRGTLETRPLDIPLTIVCHPKDELVSAKGIARLIETGSLAAADLLLLSHDPAARGTAHLAVDEDTMGAANWCRFANLAARFVANLARDSSKDT